jgi:nitronate monooxygenase
MTFLANLNSRLSLPVIAAPMFRVSYPELVIAQCKAGVVGAFPAANARPQSELDVWLTRIRKELAAYDTDHPQQPAAPFAVNLILHKSNTRLEDDLAVCIKHKVPIIITSLGARPDIAEAVHAYGGIVLHDVTTIVHARKAIERGADGLIAICAGGGGHSGRINPFAFVQELRSWWDGPLVLAGAIANGRSILAALNLGADLVYIGSPFIATREAAVGADYKLAITQAAAGDIVYTDAFTGVHGNYLRSSIMAAGLDPDNLDIARAEDTAFRSASNDDVKAWRDIWGCGQGIGLIDRVLGAGEMIAQWRREYDVARRSCA